MKSLKKNAILNATQNICKILFPLITIPYASRVLKATNYGKVSFGNSIIRYFILFAALGVSTYSQREAPAFREDKKKLNRFANQVFTINVSSTLLSYLILIVLMIFSYKLKDYRMLILIQSLSIILMTIGADWVNIIYEDYFYITIRYIVIQCLSLFMLFFLVRSPKDYFIYALINVIATAGGNLFNVFYIRKYVKLKLASPKQCIRHLKPILLLFCVSITTIIYVSSDITIIGLFMSDSDVGIYTLSANIYSVVKQVISAVITVSIPRMAYYLGNNMSNEYKELAQKIFDSLLSVLFPAIAGLIFLSRHILNVMGGAEYTDGRNALIVLSFALLFAVMAGFYSNSYLLLKKKDMTYLFATAFSALLNVGINILIIPYTGIVGAAITTLLAELVMTLIAGFVAIKEFKIIADFKVVLSGIIGVIVIGIICFAVDFIQLNSILTIFVSFIISVMAYYFILKAFNNPLINSVDNILKRIIKTN